VAGSPAAGTWAAVGTAWAAGCSLAAGRRSSLGRGEGRSLAAVEESRTRRAVGMGQRHSFVGHCFGGCEMGDAVGPRRLRAGPCCGVRVWYGSWECLRRLG
jgi:hypothetical protein